MSVISSIRCFNTQYENISAIISAKQKYLFTLIIPVGVIRYRFTASFFFCFFFLTNAPGHGGFVNFSRGNIQRIITLEYAVCRQCTAGSNINSHRRGNSSRTLTNINWPLALLTVLCAFDLFQLASNINLT